MPFLRTIKNTATDDQELISLFKKSGELRYIGELYERYMPLAYGVCLQYFDAETAKDMVMQVFEILIKKLPEHEVHHFKSWLHVVVRNYCLMRLRKEKNKENRLISLEENQLMETADSMHHENGFSPEENLQILEKCMETLPAEQKSSVDLFYLKEKSYKEIVTLTGYDLKKVKSYIQNGKRNLKICMEKHPDA